jgi:hypothetical protein
MFTIDALIAPFEAVSLRELEEVTLLNRSDTKFVFGAEKLPVVLDRLYDSYSILEVNGTRLQHYDTLYFDTYDRQLYLRHHNKRQNRFKVRNRKYLDSGQCYFEVKFKNNKGRTIKERNKYKGAQMEVIEGKQEELLASVTGFPPAMLQPSLEVLFSRITLVDRRFTERVTIDTDLRFRHGGKEMGYPGLVIAEVKQNRSASSAIAHILHKVHIPKTRISKYCLGIISLDQHIKQNNFKHKLHIINKLNHDCCETHNDALPAGAPGLARQGLHSATG